ncbi:MAG TPA: hypothetical protein VG871_12315 [Vicinamibacterales bacterium]|nr:hypothetical protein [Vicinamibacterales bacterium]
MTTTQTIQVDVPSTRRLVTATLGALAAAAVILVAFVLPAEYGIDPLHTGRALGLTDLASAPEAASKPAEKPVAASAAAPTPAAEPARPFINPTLVPSPTGDAPTVKDTFIAQPAGFHFDSRAITLAPGEGMEIKYDMKTGAGLVYSWTASATIPYEFHGEPDVKPAGKEGTDYYESYELNDKRGARESHGTFVAPTTGIHGWFWENTTGRPVTLTLVSSGFFDWISQNRHDKHTALKPIDVAALPSHPGVPDEAFK